MLLPGGSGSQLFQSRAAYRGRRVDPFLKFRRAWLRPIKMRKYLLQLAVRSNGRDVRDHVLTPRVDYPVSNPVTNPYDRIQRYFGQRLGWNYVVFCYDWRRPLTEWGDYLLYFLQQLIGASRERRFQRPVITLVGHSMGGLVATLMLHRLEELGEDVADWLCAAITVATSFYGTWPALERLYSGEDFVRRLSRLPARDVARIVASMPGPYRVLFPDEATWDRDRAELAKTAYPLTDYPVRDAATGARADPHDAANARRFPRWVMPQRLAAGAYERQRLTAPLDPRTHERMFHVRSGLIPMSVTRKWHAIDGSRFDPGRDPSPVEQLDRGPGDNRVPAWSARHVHTPHGNVFDAQQARGHVTLIRHPETHAFIRDVVRGCTGASPAGDEPVEGFEEEQASIAETAEFLDAVAEGRIRPDDDMFYAPRFWLTFMEQVML